MKKYLGLLCAIFFIAACDTRLSNSELSSQIISSMEQTYAGSNIDLKIDSLIITRESSDSNVYTGVLETTEPNGNFTYTVRITYDGENFTWAVE